MSGALKIMCRCGILSGFSHKEDASGHESCIKEGIDRSSQSCFVGHIPVDQEAHSGIAHAHPLIDDTIRINRGIAARDLNLCRPGAIDIPVHATLLWGGSFSKSRMG